MEPKSEKPTPNRRKKTVMILVGVVCLGIALYFGIQWLLFRWHYVSTDDAQGRETVLRVQRLLDCASDGRGPARAAPERGIAAERNARQT